jgi:hypothetical protein
MREKISKYCAMLDQELENEIIQATITGTIECYCGSLHNIQANRLSRCLSRAEAWFWRQITHNNASNEVTGRVLATHIYSGRNNYWYRRFREAGIPSEIGVMLSYKHIAKLLQQHPVNPYNLQFDTKKEALEWLDREDGHGSVCQMMIYKKAGDEVVRFLEEAIFYDRQVHFRPMRIDVKFDETENVVTGLFGRIAMFQLGTNWYRITLFRVDLTNKPVLDKWNSEWDHLRLYHEELVSVLDKSWEVGDLVKKGRWRIIEGR